MSVYNVLDYGAVGDGQTSDRAAIQQAVDACTGAGGGTVLLPAGHVFLAGEIVLKSHVNLHVEGGAKVIASTNPADYDERIFIKADGAVYVSITGFGEIDCRGVQFMCEEGDYIYYLDRDNDFRFNAIKFINCRHITLRDFTLRDTPAWGIHLAGCDDVVINGLRIYNNMKVPNCDGIDPDHSRNVRISDCHIEAGDDCIVLKTRPEHNDLGPCENITVTGCTLMSASAALKIGTETYDDIRNVIFDGCVIRGSNRGLAVVLRDQGDVENILFSNCIIETQLYHDDWWGKAEPIYVTAYPRTPDTQLGKLRNIRFSNIVCRGENGAFISGCEATPVEGLVLDNVRLEIVRPQQWRGGVYDMRPGDGAEIFRHPTAGVFIRQAHDVFLRDVEVRWGESPPDYFDAALHTDTVTDLRRVGFRGRAAQPGQASIILTDTRETAYDDR